MITAYLGLGANLGDPIQQLIDARRELAELDGVRQMQCSSFYVSSPVGYSGQDDFVNCVVELVGDIELRSLFTGTQAIEHKLGRVRDPENQNAARLIDIDLLLFGEQNISSFDLIVPHPRISQRLFVLLPLAEFNPGLIVDKNLTVAQLLRDRDFSDQQIMKLDR